MRARQGVAVVVVVGVWTSCSVIVWCGVYSVCGGHVVLAVWMTGFTWLLSS